MTEPTPWKIQIVGHIGHVIDANRDTVIALGADDAEFWQRIIKAVNNHDALVKALEFIRDGYDNHDVSHVDYRVKVYQVALDALAAVEAAGQSSSALSEDGK